MKVAVVVDLQKLHQILVCWKLLLMYVNDQYAQTEQ